MIRSLTCEARPEVWKPKQHKCLTRTPPSSQRLEKHFLETTDCILFAVQGFFNSQQLEELGNGDRSTEAMGRY